MIARDTDAARAGFRAETGPANYMQTTTRTELRGGLLRVDGLAYLLRNRGERFRLPHREVGEHLAIDLDAGGVQSVDEHAVRHVVLPRRGVDTHDPEAAEIALLVLAVAIRVAPAALHGFLRGLPELAASAKGSLGGLHHLLLTAQADDVRLYAWH